MTARILVVEDELAMREGLVELLANAGHAADGVASGEEALARLRREPRDLVITDLRLGGMDGVALLDKVRAEWPETAVIVVTAFSTVPSAVEAMSRGAFHYLPKPFSIDEVRLTVERAIESRRLSAENRRLRRELADARPEAPLVGAGPAMRSVLDLVRRVAPTGSTVLILGETGTGKEIVARAIHAASPRADRPFVTVHSAAIPEGLLEAELFGHRRGAFTGADEDRTGLVEGADGGTLFLDEIGEVPLPVQVKLLRLLEEGEVRRVGDTEVRRVDIRVVAATHRDLAAMVREGRFREDLFYRLDVVTVRIPPLRERTEEIPALATYFLACAARDLAREPLRITPAAMGRLSSHRWSGNVRELRNVLERAAILAPGTDITPADLPAEIGGGPGTIDPESFRPLDAVEHDHVLRVLRACGGNRSRAAEALGISRRTLHRMLRRYGEAEA